MAVVPSTNEFRVRKDTTPLYAHILKWGLLALATLAALYVVQKLIAQGSWFGVVITAFILFFVAADVIVKALLRQRDTDEERVTLSSGWSGR